MKNLSRLLLVCLLFACIGLGYWLGSLFIDVGGTTHSSQTKPPPIYLQVPRKPSKVDTVILTKQVKVNVTKFVPVIVKTYLPDTALRKSLISGKVFAGAELNISDHEAETNTIDTNSRFVKSSFKLSEAPVKSITVLPDGNLIVISDSTALRRDKRRQRWRRIGNTTLMGAALVLGLIMGKGG